MKRIWLLVSLVLASGCAHVASSTARFSQTGAGDTARLVLRISRHMDTVARGPDIEEDQLLVLTLYGFALRQKLAIPSAAVTPTFTVSRLGPDSRGDTFHGYIIVRSVTADKVEATLSLTVTARTTDGSYRQEARFRGDCVFVPDAE
jgi:hypothetical protein